MELRERFRGWHAVLATLAAGSLGLIAARAMQARPAIADEPGQIAAEDIPKENPQPSRRHEVEPVVLSPKEGPSQAPTSSTSPFDLEPAPKGVATAATRRLMTDDPEGSAAEFLDRSRREAGEAVRALSAEAETLRAKLAKTEAGLKRWQNVLEALNGQIRPGNEPASPKLPAEPEPILEPASLPSPPPVAPNVPEPVAPPPEPFAIPKGR